MRNFYTRFTKVFLCNLSFVYNKKNREYYCQKKKLALYNANNFNGSKGTCKYVNT